MGVSFSVFLRFLMTTSVFAFSAWTGLTWLTVFAYHSRLIIQQVLYVVLMWSLCLKDFRDDQKDSSDWCFSGGKRKWEVSGPWLSKLLAWIYRCQSFSVLQYNDALYRPPVDLRPQAVWALKAFSGNWCSRFCESAFRLNYGFLICSSTSLNMSSMTSQAV